MKITALYFGVLLIITSSVTGSETGQRLRKNRRLQESSSSWRERVKEKGEVTWQEKKRAAMYVQQACNSSTDLTIVTPIALLCQECYAYYLSSSHGNLHYS
jgi:hypothetical protein